MMLDTKQNRDLIIVYCDRCASNIRLYASELIVPLHEAVQGMGWRVEQEGMLGRKEKHTCWACLRKEEKR
jgi:hypothetical protein